MAVTTTPRLGLNKQAAGDPTWAGPLNSGFDNADARFMTTSAGSPVGVQQGFYVGQTHFQTGTSPPTIWICTVVGSPGTWVLAGQVGLGYNGITGALILNNLIALQAKETGGTARNVAFMDAANKIILGALTNLLTLQTSTAVGLKVNYGAGDQTIWHAGNDGAGSGLDADTVDGINGTDLMTAGGDDLEVDIDISGVAGSYAHGLSGAPTDLAWYLRKTGGAAEGGWVTNDRIYNHRLHATNAMDIGADGTNVYWARVNNVEIVNKAGSSTLLINLADWRMTIRAWI